MYGRKILMFSCKLFPIITLDFCLSIVKFFHNKTPAEDKEIILNEFRKYNFSEDAMLKSFNLIIKEYKLNIIDINPKHLNTLYSKVYLDGTDSLIRMKKIRSENPEVAHPHDIWKNIVPACIKTMIYDADTDGLQYKNKCKNH